jgi:hypothetical protein
MQFFEMSYRNYSPWIRKFVRKKDDCIVERKCLLCGDEWVSQKNENHYDRPFEAMVEKKGSTWTDIIGNGSEPHFTIVSQRVLEIWEAEGVGTFPAFSITILPPYPKKMTEPPPTYYRLDYKQMVGAELDFEASGYVDVKYCDACQNYSYDRKQSDRIRDFKITPYILKKGTWNGANIFRLKFPVGFMFCTEKVVDCAAKHKMTNFEFTPLEIAGSAVTFRGVDYMAKNWRKKMAKQLEEFRKNFRPIDPVVVHDL